MKRTRIAVLRARLLVAGLLLGGATAAAEAGPPDAAGDAASLACPASEEFVTPDNALLHVAAAIRAGRLDILALGSATTIGREGPTGSSFPYRMAERLRAAYPGVKIGLRVRGGRGFTAEAMLPLLQQALAEPGGPPALVLWQTGTVEAVRGIRPDDLREALDEGAQRIRAAGADLVLIDPQFSRFLRANADLDPYEQVLRQYATLPDVALFRRFDLMRGWASDGGLDLERTPEAERPHAIQALQSCLGDALARYVMNGAAMPPR